MGLDFDTSTRNKLTLMHARADTNDDDVARLVEAFGAELVLSCTDSEGSLRREATEDRVPTTTIEMDEADRFQPVLIERAITGVEDLMAAYNLLSEGDSRPPTFRKILESESEKTWLRADTGALVEMTWGPHFVVDAGEKMCVISDYFGEENHVIEAPFMAC